MVDNFGLPRKSCLADFTINNNDDDIVNAFIDNKLVIVNVDTAEPTDMVGDDGTPFFVDAKQEGHQKTWYNTAINAHLATTLLVKKR